MLDHIPKHRRNGILVASAGVVLISIILLIIYLITPADATYLPGQEVEGLTTDLSRDLPPDYPKVTFADATSEAGIRFEHFQGERTIQLPEDMGSGAAWGDYDQDGWIDLFVVNFAGPINAEGLPSPDAQASCALYHNNGDGTFSEVSQQAGVNVLCWGMAACWGDYDNDHWPDLFLTSYGDLYLFHNNGDGTFSNMTSQAGMAAYRGFWSGASWGDLNTDGYLDLYVCGYVQYDYQTKLESSKQYDVEVPASINPSSFPPAPNLLFLNQGNGTFREIAVKAGVDNPTGRSLSATWADLNEDGLPDIYVANDVSDNVLYQNMGNGTFKEVSHNALVADYRGAMGIAVGDWDRDADYDMFITHWVAQENALYSNLFTQLTSNENPLFELRFMDEADRFGLGQIALDYIGWGTSFFDYNNDGWADLYVANGSTFQKKENAHELVPMQDLLFWNKGYKDGFFDVSSVSGQPFSQLRVGRGAAFGDYDNDGDVDIFVVNNGESGQLLRNDGGNQHHWLEVRLTGTKSNRSAIGAKVSVITAEARQVQQVGSQGPYCSQNSPVQHFGIGTQTHVDSLIITWPSGSRQHFANLPADQILIIEEGKQEARPQQRLE